MGAFFVGRNFFGYWFHFMSFLSLSRHSVLVSVAISLLCLLCLAVYDSALEGPFLLDDYENLAVMGEGVDSVEALRDYLSTGNAGPLGRPIAKLSFLLNDYAWPSNPLSFKVTNLYIHLLCGLAIFCLFRQLFFVVLKNEFADWLAIAVMAIFLLHPLQMSTVMYVVQRMAQLSGLFILAGVASHLYFRRLLFQSEWLRLVLLTLSLAIWGAAAVFSKESGVLLPVFILIVEVTVGRLIATSRMLVVWRLVCIWVPTVLLVVYLLYLPRWLPSYAGRDFSFEQRIFTESVILLDYMKVILTMRVYGMGLFQDDFPIYSSFLDPIVFGSVVFWLSGFWMAVVLRKKYPIFSLGILWFLVAHLLESTTIALELYFEHRNYIAILGICIAVGALLIGGLNRISDKSKQLFSIIIVAVLSFASMGSYGNSVMWGSLERLIAVWALEHPESSRAQRAYAHLLAANDRPTEALDLLDSLAEKFPEDLSIPVMSLDISCVFGLPMRYSIDSLVRDIESYTYSNALRLTMTKYVDGIPGGACSDETGSVHKLLSQMHRLKKIDVDVSPRSIFALLDGNLYMKEGRADLALPKYEFIEARQPTVDSAVRLSGFFLLVKDYEKAKEYLELARVRNAKRSRLKAYSEAEFAEKFELIETLKSE